MRTASSATMSEVFVHAILWTEDGGMQDPGTLGEVYEDSWAVDINNKGQVIGISSINKFSQNASQHIFLLENGVMTDLGEFIPYSINDHGQIVGRSEVGCFL